MGWYRRNKGGRGTEAEARLSALAQKLADRILAQQSRWAVRLNAQALRLGKWNTIAILGVLVMGMACYCAYLLLGAFF
ncbi:hypothetical protein [Pedobacter sp. UC225_65]|uniref:hypothetical protein n=1 Tax=Pedobacter sp. UC225_65 TaxID=3350173 RepID=UPI0036732E00